MSLFICPRGRILNPETGNCIQRKSTKARSLIKKYCTENGLGYDSKTVSCIPPCDPADWRYIVKVPNNYFDWYFRNNIYPPYPFFIPSQQPPLPLGNVKIKPLPFNSSWLSQHTSSVNPELGDFEKKLKDSAPQQSNLLMNIFGDIICRIMDNTYFKESTANQDFNQLFFNSDVDQLRLASKDLWDLKVSVSATNCLSFTYLNQPFGSYFSYNEVPYKTALYSLYIYLLLILDFNKNLIPVGLTFSKNTFGQTVVITYKNNSIIVPVCTKISLENVSLNTSENCSGKTSSDEYSITHPSQLFQFKTSAGLDNMCHTISALINLFKDQLLMPNFDGFLRFNDVVISLMDLYRFFHQLRILNQKIDRLLFLYLYYAPHIQLPKDKAYFFPNAGKQFHLLLNESDSEIPVVKWSKIKILNLSLSEKSISEWLTLKT